MAAFALDRVLGTTRHPDGRTSGDVDGLVLRENGVLVVIDLLEALERARQHRLVVSVAGEADARAIVVLDAPDGGQTLGVEGSPDEIRHLPIWDRGRVCWVNPLRPGGARLAGPGA